VLLHHLTGHYPILLAIAYVGSTFFSIDRDLSIWGSFSRQSGLLTELCYMSIFCVVASSFRSQANAVLLIRVVVLGSTPVILYGLAQSYGLDPVSWIIADKSPIISTLGRSNFVGSYLTMLIPLCVAAIVIELPFVERFATIVILASAIYLAIHTTARATWLALVVVGCVMGFIYARQLPDGGLFALSVAAILTVAIGVLSVGILYLGNRQGIDLPPAIQVLLDSSSLKARVSIWTASWNLVVERPALGFGPDTFRLAFYHVYPPELVFYQGRDSVTDRAHNEFVQRAVDAGIPGLLS
jgi:O-antigen ligase